MAEWQLSARSRRWRFFSKADADPEQSTITGQSAGGMSISAPDRAVCSGKQSAGVGWCRSGTGQETTFMPTVSTVGFSANPANPAIGQSFGIGQLSGCKPTVIGNRGSKVCFLLCRTHTPDPQRPVAASEVQRQVSERSGCYVYRKSRAIQSWRFGLLYNPGSFNGVWSQS